MKNKVERLLLIIEGLIFTAITIGVLCVGGGWVAIFPGFFSSMIWYEVFDIENKDINIKF